MPDWRSKVAVFIQHCVTKYYYYSFACSMTSIFVINVLKLCMLLLTMYATLKFHTCVMRPPRVVLIVLLWCLNQVLYLSAWWFNGGINIENFVSSKSLSILFVMMMQMLIIGWLYLSSQMFRTLEVVNVQVGVWRGQLQVVSLLQPSQDYRHHSLMTDRESRVFFDSLLLPWSMRSTTAFQ